MIKSVWKCINIIAISPKRGMEQAEIIDTFWTYHMADALSRKSYSNNLILQQGQPLLHEEFRKLNLHIVPRGFLSTLVAKPTLMDQVIKAQKVDPGISRIKRNIKKGVAGCFSIDDQGVVFFR